jgi:transposase
MAFGSFIKNIATDFVTNCTNWRSRADLIRENKYLRAKVAALTAEVARLVAEVKDLKEKLGLNSTNSSLPPSRDLYKATKQKNKSGRKQGAQPGHKGVGRKLVPISRVNHVVKCEPSSKCECGGTVHIKTSYRRHQVHELPEIKPIITEYQLHDGKCVDCKQKVWAELPRDVGINVLGPRAMALMTQLSSQYHLSKRLIRKFFGETLGIRICTGTVSNTEGRVSNALAEPYKNLEASLATQAHLNIDETGYKEHNKRGYVWVFASNSICVFKAKLSRAKSVLIETLKNFHGKVTSDRYSAYNVIPTQNRQSCWAHLIRDFRRFSHSQYEDVQAIGKELLEKSEQIFSIRALFKSGQIQKEQLLDKIKPVRQSIEKLLRKGSMMFLRKSFSVSCGNIFNMRRTLWLWLEDLSIEPTNNLAERQLRPYVIWRKLSFGSQSERGSRFVERTMSIIATCGQSGTDVFELLVKSILDYRRNCQPPPTK